MQEIDLFNQNITIYIKFMSYIFLYIIKTINMKTFVDLINQKN
jgi:hypothetical protein